MVKNLPAVWETQVQSLGLEDPLEEEMATQVFLPGKFHGQRNLVGYSPWGCNESVMTEQLTLSTSFKIVNLQQANFELSTSTKDCGKNRLWRTQRW